MVVSLRLGSAPRVSSGAAIISVRTIATGLHLNFLVSVRAMIDTLQPIKLSYPLNSGTCSGSCERLAAGSWRTAAR